MLKLAILRSGARVLGFKWPKATRDDVKHMLFPIQDC